MAAIAWWSLGLDPVVIFLAVTHGIVVLALMGRGPAAAFDGRKEWRERFRMDDNAANRLGKAILRAGASLPYIILAGLAPKQGMMFGILAIGGASLGLLGLVKLKTWGVLGLVGAFVGAAFITQSANTVVAVALLGAAFMPFVTPFARFVIDSAP